MASKLSLYRVPTSSFVVSILAPMTPTTSSPHLGINFGVNWEWTNVYQHQWPSRGSLGVETHDQTTIVVPPCLHSLIVGVDIHLFNFTKTHSLTVGLHVQRLTAWPWVSIYIYSIFIFMPKSVLKRGGDEVVGIVGAGAKATVEETGWCYDVEALVSRRLPYQFSCWRVKCCIKYHINL